MYEGKQPPGSEARLSAPTGDSGWADLRHTVTELLRILLLRKWMFFVPFCLTMTGALLYSHRLPRQYKASTVFERRTDVATSRLAREGSPHEFKALLWSFNFDIVDPEAMGEVVDHLGWTGDFPQDAQGRLTPQGEKMRRSLADSCTKGLAWKFPLRAEDLDQIELTYTGDDPEKAWLLVEEIRDTYIRRTQKRIISLLRDARDYYRRKLEENQAEEARLAEGVLRFEIEYPGIDPSRPGTIAEKLALLESKQGDLSRRAWELGAEIASREALVNGTPAVLPEQPASGEEASSREMVVNPRRADLERRIREFEMEISDLQLTRHMTDEHPGIVSLRRGMQAAAEALAAEPERIPREAALAVVSGPAGSGAERSDVAGEIWELQKARIDMELASLRANRTRTEADQKEFARQIASLETMQAGIFERQREYEQLRQDLERARAEVSVWAGRLGDLERTIDVESHNREMGFSVVVPAGRSTRPVSPRFMTVITLSLMVALGVGVGVVLLAELMDRRMRTINQVVRATSLPILETIGEILTPGERRSRFLRDVVLKPALALVLALVAGASAYAAYTSIEYPGTWERWKSHLVLSLEHSDGGQAAPGSA